MGALGSRLSLLVFLRCKKIKLWYFRSTAVVLSLASFRVRICFCRVIRKLSQGSCFEREASGPAERVQKIVALLRGGVFGLNKRRRGKGLKRGCFRNSVTERRIARRLRNWRLCFNNLVEGLRNFRSVLEISRLVAKFKQLLF